MSSTTLWILSVRGGIPPFLPPPPFRWKIGYGFGGYPFLPPPLTDFSSKNFLQKGLKIVFFAQKNLILVQK